MNWIELWPECIFTPLVKYLYENEKTNQLTVFKISQVCVKIVYLATLVILLWETRPGFERWAKSFTINCSRLNILSRICNQMPFRFFLLEHFERSTHGVFHAECDLTALENRHKLSVKLSLQNYIYSANRTLYERCGRVYVTVYEHWDRSACSADAAKQKRRGGSQLTDAVP